MIKPRWQLGLEAEAAELRALAQERRAFSTIDPVAEALDRCAERLETRTQRILEPTRELTPDEWGAEQEPPVSGKTARRWIHRGELEFVERTGGVKILAGTRRVPPLVEAEGMAEVDDTADELPLDGPLEERPRAIEQTPMAAAS